MLEIAGQNIDISKLIYTIRDKQVMLDSDLAIIYGYEVKRLNEQIASTCIYRAGNIYVGNGIKW